MDTRFDDPPFSSYEIYSSYGVVVATTLLIVLCALYIAPNSCCTLDNDNSNLDKKSEEY